MTEYRVNLDIFAGPLDLLLYLVRKEEVDIYDIPIARITDQYVKYVEMLKRMDIDLAGDFLVLAATLMEIKSVMLLPKSEPGEAGYEDIVDPREELVRQLLEYKKFKDAANLLEDSADARKDRFTRPDSLIAALKSDQQDEVDIEQISIWTLLEAFDGIMQATGRLAEFDHITDDTPIDLYEIDILNRLQAEGSLTLESIFQGRTNRMVLAGLFLAMLELIRLGLIRAEQTRKLGSPVFLRALTDEPAAEAVRNAIITDEERARSRPEKTKQPSIPIRQLPAKQSTTKTQRDDAPADDTPISIKEI
ncbi:MAG TPA: segregation/condensation protein A [Planctomycetes bacterium]|nr:segregation/condensation protein A [Planctomycetota bacterium]HIJ72190.1 segregation/condensation protein A [Planctomycetota bacterium]